MVSKHVQEKVAESLPWMQSTSWEAEGYRPVELPLRYNGLHLLVLPHSLPECPAERDGPGRGHFRSGPKTWLCRRHGHRKTCSLQARLGLVAARTKLDWSF